MGLAGWGLKLTRFERTAQGHFYTPNTYLGLTLIAVLIIRLPGRLFQLQAAGQLRTASPQAYAALGPGPLARGPLFVIIGYYVCSERGVLRLSRAGRASA
ncbi:hypothetical protein HNR42_002742 [Deinobacterium chartae]|uniref:Uncharacterized protein n=1 Tax=Deinobacterium chartae TaxID=521158 RepID=A0A841I2R4_9DEIO|nr:hypothetical protein [Deinobacterium chartae]MBB6099304.1 hypothetical protein [Deinobacterium chartae]